MVYFIREGDKGPIKIGHTFGSPARRAASLQTGNSRGLRVLNSAPGSRKAEAGIHRALRRWRIRGEWFTPHPIVVRFSLCPLFAVDIGECGLSLANEDVRDGLGFLDGYPA
jgi:hypothetical protein